jgi:pantoate--beta-alanine ligase
MKIVRDVPALAKLREGWKGQALGFVPTMGALHAGHEALVRASLARDERTVVSVFLNPTQFDDAADLEAYPADTAADVDALRSWGADAVFLPQADALYPDGYRYRVTEQALSKTLCGAQRPGHFDGVLTVVMRLLNVVRAERAYFGEKDWQQLQLVRGMVKAFFMPVEIVACPTVREADGLALSSRNRRLDPEARRQAAAFPRLLERGPDAESVRRALVQAGFAVDYVEERDGRRLAAVRLGPVRLIDNVPVPAPPPEPSR